ncbi:ead/Ea22-like family protein [Enterobacter roggenkampii]|uniref:ead/Ea22-like family protein n=1 Tax=Enterobacter roggenkampii TaxID=1812935 RepID=UPI000F83D105|nr:ead/Ea22-like family protein [Enterobacter roggenkampii]RTO96836.1 ead/Ea22-like family protein [Enterobacter roggenkampii]
MSNIDKRVLREAAEKALNARARLALMQSVFDDDGDDVKPEAQEDISICVSFNDLTNPATVLALLDELEAKDKRLNENLTPNMLLPVIGDMDEDNLRHVIKTVSENYSLLHAKWESAEKRIAELEAREVVLPSVQDVHPLGPQSAKIFCEFHRSIVNRCADEIRKVGVKVSIKGN